MDRTNNTIRNSAWGMVYKVISLLAPFSIRTIIIRQLGVEYLGLSSLFASILQVLNMAELGFSSAVVFSMYKPIAENDTITICALMNLYKKIYSTIGTVIFCVGIILTPFVPFLISGTYPGNINIYLLYLLYLFNTGISYFLFAYKSALLNAHQRYDIISNTLSIVMVLQYAFQIVVLIVFKNYYLYYIFTPVFSIVYNIGISIVTTRKYPQYLAKGTLDKSLLDDIKRRVKGLMLGKICGTTRNTFDSIIISGFIGLTAVAVYGNYYYIISNVAGVLSVFTTAMSAGVGNSVAAESVDKNYNDFRKITFLYAWISGWCTVCLVTLYQPFMKIWVGKDLMFSFGIVVCFCLYFYILSTGDIRSVYMNATGLWWENRYRTLFEAAANLVLNLILVQFWGVAGVILSTLISLFIFNFFMSTIILFKHYFNTKKALSYFADYGIHFVVTLVACVVTYTVSSFVNVTGYEIVNLLLKGLICLVLPNLIFTACYFRNRNFEEAKVMARKILRR